MVIGLLAIAGIPTTIGVCEALSAQKKQNEAQKEKVKFHATTELSLGDGPPVECSIVLTGGKLYIDHPNAPAEGHKFAGYYFTYPSEEKHLGLVSTIADDPPMLNWIFFDKDTGIMRHAGRKETIGHKIGPWGWSDDDKWLTFDGSTAGFVAVEDQESKKWNIFLDRGSSENPVDETQDDPGVDGEEGRRRQRRIPITIRRRTELGMESRYIRDGDR